VYKLQFLQFVETRLYFWLCLLVIAVYQTAILAFSLIHGGAVILAIAGTYFWPWPDLCP